MNSRSVSPLPLNTAQATFDTHRLKKCPDGSLVLCRSWFAIVFFAIFYLGTIGTAIYGVAKGEYKLLFFSIPVLLLTCYFDRQQKTACLDPAAGELTAGRHQYAFTRIAAFQVVRHGSVYQLNLVAANGERRNLIPSVHDKAARAIARELADAVGVPVFDREQETEPVAADGVIRAENICRGPVKAGGTSLRTHKLIRQRDGRYVFQPSYGTQGTLITLPFCLGGAIGAVAGCYCLATMRWKEGSFLVLWSAVFGIPLWWRLALQAGKPVFDPENRIFFRGRRRRDELPFREIAALQILSELCHGQKGRSYESYELNLVLKDGTRVNIVDHGDLKQLRKDAETLSGILNVPLIALDSN